MRFAAGTVESSAALRLPADTTFVTERLDSAKSSGACFVRVERRVPVAALVTLGAILTI